MNDPVSLSSTHFLSPSPQKKEEKFDKIRDVCEKMEASFLAEMLKEARLGEAPEEFGGGIGEEQFGSFMRQAQADEMAKSGGIGLAESLFQTLTKSATESR